MNYEKFAIWLSGFADLNMGQVPTKEQWELITERLAETFDKPDPAHIPSPRKPATGGHVAYDPSKFGVWGEHASEAIVASPAVIRTARGADGLLYADGLGIGVNVNNSAALTTTLSTGMKDAIGQIVSEHTVRADK